MDVRERREISPTVPNRRCYPFTHPTPDNPRLATLVVSQVTRVIAGQRVTVNRIDYVPKRGVREAGEVRER